MFLDNSSGLFTKASQYPRRLTEVVENEKEPKGKDTPEVGGQNTPRVNDHATDRDHNTTDHDAIHRDPRAFNRVEKLWEDLNTYDDAPEVGDQKSPTVDDSLPSISHSSPPGRRGFDHTTNCDRDHNATDQDHNTTDQDHNATD
ncbi:hypothetical protein C8R42DRAFT_637397 [Lentinula raphanica]|nr:hypothetical protein C8R42DRAFT_637397 [Lentinula raphanica]